MGSPGSGGAGRSGRTAVAVAGIVGMETPALSRVEAAVSIAAGSEDIAGTQHTSQSSIIPISH